MAGEHCEMRSKPPSYSLLIVVVRLSELLFHLPFFKGDVPKLSHTKKYHDRQKRRRRAQQDRQPQQNQQETHVDRISAVPEQPFRYQLSGIFEGVDLGIHL